MAMHVNVEAGGELVKAHLRALRWKRILFERRMRASSAANGHPLLGRSFRLAEYVFVAVVLELLAQQLDFVVAVVPPALEDAQDFRQWQKSVA